MSRVTDVEYSALQALVEGEKRISEQGVVLWLVASNPGVFKVVGRTELAKRLGSDRMRFNARAAIERYQGLQAAGGGSATTQTESRSGDPGLHTGTNAG